MIVHVFHHDLLALFCRGARWDFKQFSARLNEVSSKSVDNAMNPRRAHQRLCGGLTTMDLRFTGTQVIVPRFTYGVRALRLGHSYRYQ